MFFNQVAVGEGDLDSCHPYEVWGLAWTAPEWYGLPYRYDFCKGQFVQIPLPSNPEALSQISRSRPVEAMSGRLTQMLTSGT